MRRELAQAVDDLVARDAVVAELVDRHGPCRLPASSPAAGRFEALTRSICGQQVAGAAARAIHGRFLDLFDGAPTPAAVLATHPDLLRGVGLSGSKAASIVDLALHVENGDVRLANIGRYGDADVVEQLTVVRGIGPWTAHMFLMFQLGRLDVWPTGDFGVRKGYGRAWTRNGDAPTARDLEELGDSYRPYRSVVAWYCWRAAGDETAGPANAGDETASP